MKDATKLVGRRKVLSDLRRLFAAAKKGSGGIVLLTGTAGVGRTRLAEESLTAGGLAILRGRAASEATPPYGPLTSALRGWLRHKPQGRSGKRSLDPVLSLLLPEIGPSPETADRAGLVEAITSTLAGIAQRQPTVLFLDDLQWSDHATLELLPGLAERLERERLLILGSYCGDEIPRGHPVRWLRNELRRAGRLREIIVEPLGPEDSAKLIEEVLGAPPGPDLVRSILERAQGIPLYVEELARALTGGLSIRKSEAGLELVSGQVIPVPEGLRDAVLLRIESLTEPAREKLEIAAVAGSEFPLQVVTSIAGEEAGLAELFDRKILVEGEPGRAAFHHALTREAVREEILWSRRRHLNREVAAYMERCGGDPDQIAEHWLAANALDRARGALLESAERSCRLYAYGDAARAAHKALEIWPENVEEEERLRVLEQLAHCAQVSGQLGEAARAWREVLDSPRLASNPGRRGAALRSQATVMELQGAAELALAARKGAAGAFEACGESGESATEWLSAAKIQVSLGDSGGALESARRAIRFAEMAGRMDLSGRALAMEGHVLSIQGHAPEGKIRVEAGLSLALKHNLNEVAAEAYRRLGSALEYHSDFGGAAEAYTAALDFCQEQSVEVEAQACKGCMSYVLYRNGDWKRCLKLCREIVAREQVTEGSRSIAWAVLGLIRMHRGEVKEARRFLETCLTQARRYQRVLVELIAAWGLAQWAEQAGKLVEAESLYRQLLTRWRDTDDRHDVIPALCSAATFFGSGGHKAELAAATEALTAIASATGNPEALAGLAFALGETALLHGKPGEAATQFAKSLGYHENLEIPLERARAELRAGVAFSRSGAREETLRHLERAYRMARKLGARPLAAEAAEQMSRLGEKAEERTRAAPGEPAPRGGLSRRQLEVARLLATGLTNKEIADRLFVSARTVDMHVSHVLNRLNCRSRAEAVRRAGELGLLP
jgi:DNA-binding CsgD family transcriptional regulator